MVDWQLSLVLSLIRGGDSIRGLAWSEAFVLKLFEQPLTREGGVVEVLLRFAPGILLAYRRVGEVLNRGRCFGIKPGEYLAIKRDSYFDLKKSGRVEPFEGR